MADYNLSNLDPRNFEHLVQALAKKFIAPGVTPFGDGPDGGREAMYEGEMDYPARAKRWKGRLVLQCKFRKQPSGDTKKDGDWAVAQLAQELEKYSRRPGKKALTIPAYYLFVTNVKLTPFLKSGSKDRVRGTLAEFMKEHKLKGFDVWSYDEICRFLDDADGVRASYAGFITAGDVLEEMRRILFSTRANFVETMGSYLQKAIKGDRSARLESAGRENETEIPLGRVFVDVASVGRADDANGAVSYPKKGGLASMLLAEGNENLRASNVTREPVNPHLKEGANTTERSAEAGRFVIVGGPGQGKSTLGQFLCQVYRHALLKDRQVIPELKPVMATIEERFDAGEFDPPACRRFPVHVPLNEFADALACGKELTLLGYLLGQLNHRTASNCTLTDLKEWLKTYPWLIVFDGLDEVPATSNRKEVIKQIDALRVDAVVLDADLMIVVTTRPQSYAGDFAADVYKHFYLTPLSIDQALDYGQRMIRETHAGNDSHIELLTRRLESAARSEATAHLMRSPLQVTIMTTLVARFARLPQERYRLFEHYYRTIYDRETSREGPLSVILSARKTDIDIIHYRVGLLLQSESEQEGKTESRLSDARFRAVVQARLREVEVREPEATKLLDLITDSTLQRLVFLVRRQEGGIGFEIRTFQEFMAAEALLNNGERLSIERLRAIAPIVHWRNVFLFAVGICFVRHEYLLDTIESLCRQLNDDPNDPVGSTVLLGSRLALAILEEDVARQNHKYERLIAKVALELVELPDREAVSQLAAVYQAELDDTFHQVVRARLGTETTGDHPGVWALIVPLAKQGVGWASELIELQWPSDPSKQRSILQAEKDLESLPWAIAKLACWLPTVAPSDAGDFLQKFGLEPRNKNIPVWLRSAARATHMKDRDQLLAGLIQDRAVPSTAYRFIPVASSSSDDLRALVKHADLSEAWLPYVADSRFEKDPTHQSLARELRWLSKRWNPKATRHRVYPFSWPLAACLSAVEEPADLARLADRAQNGELGVRSNWQQAEERWLSQGITREDFIAMRDDRWPFDASIAESGFPFALDSLPFHLGDLWERLWPIFNASTSTKLRALIAPVLMRLTLRIFGFDQPICPRMPISDWKTLISSAARGRFGMSLSFLGCLELPETLGAAEAEFFEWLGRQRQQLTDMFDPPWPGSIRLTNLYGSHAAEYPHIITVLAFLAIAGSACPVPRNLLAPEISVVGERSRFDAQLVRLCQADWDNVECQLLARYFAQKTAMDPDVLFFIFRAMHVIQAGSAQRCDPFCCAFLGSLSAQAAGFPEQSERLIKDFLLASIRSRFSGIQNAAEWKRLELPDLGNA
jgi:hypothetical protein